MSLVQETRAALDRLNSPSDVAQTLVAAIQGQRLVCELAAIESLGCSLSSLELRSDRLAKAGIEQLRQVAEALSKRLTYLLEPICPIEVDAEHCVVQLRSNPPHKEEDRTSYYELLVARGGTLSLVRYAKQVGGTRQAVPAQLTREVLLRLIGDFSAAAA